MNKAKISAFLTAVLTMVSCTSCAGAGDNSSIQSNESNSSSSVADSNSESEISENSEYSESSAEDENTAIQWELKDVAVPELETEIIEVEGNCVEPVKKIKSFLNGDVEKINEYIENSDFYKNFNINKSVNEVAQVKSLNVETVSDENIKDDAVGYTIYNIFSGYNKDDYSSSIDFSIDRDTGTTEGFINVGISFESDIAGLEENRQNAYDLACQAMPVEIADYLFYGGTKLEELDETITNSNGITIDLKRDVQINEEYKNVDVYIWIKLYSTLEDFRTLNDDADYVPQEMEYSIADLISENIVNTDIYDSKNFGSEFFNPYPIVGVEHAFSLLKQYSTSRLEKYDGEIENKYDFSLESIYNETADTQGNIFDNSVASVSANVSTMDGEVVSYDFSLTINYYTLVTNGTDETMDYCAEAITETLQKILPNSEFEVRSFKQLTEEDYELTYDMTFEGKSVTVKVDISAHDTDSYVSANVWTKFND